MPSSRSGRRSVVAAGLLAFLASGCGAALFVPPVGPGVPAPDGVATWQQAARACHGVTSYTATLRVSGTIGTDHLPTTIGVFTGVTSDRFDLEGHAAGRSIFRLAGTRDRATLVIDDGHRVVTGTPEALTDALFGAKLGPARWLALVTGCVTLDGTAGEAARYGTDVAVTLGDARVFVSKTSDGWKIAHGIFDELVVSYSAFAFSLPSRWSLGSTPGRAPFLSLNVAVDEPRTNATINESAFSITVPADASPMSVEELRQSGPLRKGGD